jgi:hypothetical protein
MDPMMLLTLLSAVGALGASAFGGKEGEQKSTYSPQARGTLEDVLKMVNQMKGSADITQNPAYGQGMEYFNSLFNDPEFFRKFEAPARRQFEEEIVPGLANRFASMGSGGALGSTGFRNQLAREGSNLETNLAAMRGGMQANAVPQMLGYAQQPASNWMNMLGIATQPTMNQYQPPTAGGGANFLANMAGTFAQGYGNNAYNNPSAGQNPYNQQGLSRGYPLAPGQSPLTY